jgi:hypothetical protein
MAHDGQGYQREGTPPEIARTEVRRYVPKYLLSPANFAVLMFLVVLNLRFVAADTVSWSTPSFFGRIVQFESNTTKDGFSQDSYPH